MKIEEKIDKYLNEKKVKQKDKVKKIIKVAESAKNFDQLLAAYKMTDDLKGREYYDWKTTPLNAIFHIAKKISKKEGNPEGLPENFNSRDLEKWFEKKK